MCKGPVSEGHSSLSLAARHGLHESYRLMQGLDYVIAKASTYGIRLILTLQNYWPDYGGAQQWAQWYNGTSIVDYYGNKDIR